MVRHSRQPLIRPQLEEVPRQFIIISVEGASDEVKYFEAIQKKYDIAPLLEIIVTSPLDDFANNGKSAPNHVLHRAENIIPQLKSQRKSFDLRKGDQIWLVMDVDRWRENLHTVIDEAKRRGYHLAISNFSFNTWISMHSENCKCTSENKLITCSTKQCKACCNFYGKDFNVLVSNVFKASQFAKNCETKQSVNSNSEIPPCPGSRMYRLIEQLKLVKR